MNETLEVPENNWLGASGLRGVISALLVEKFNVLEHQLSASARLDEDLCLDSLELLDFGMMLQDRLDITLALDVLGLARTLQDLVDLVQASLLEKDGKKSDQHV